MASTLIRKQKLDTLIDTKALVATYNTSVAGRVYREGLVQMVRLEGWDAVKAIATATLAAIAAVVFNPVIMAATGTLSRQTPKVGQTIAAVHSQWDGIPAPTHTYQWKSNGSNATGTNPTTSVYTPVSADIGHTIACVVTATNTGGSATETLTAANVCIA